MANAKETLPKLLEIEGCVGACIVDSNSGMTLGSLGGNGLDLEAAAAGNTEVVRAKRKTMKALSLNDNIEEANRKKNLLLAKQRRADAQKRINETMSHISEKSAFEAFARMEEKIDANERKVKANAEIDEEFSGYRLANDFKRLEAAGGNQSAEVLLIELKQKMGVLPAGSEVNSSRALGAGRKAEEAFEVEEINEEKK